MAKLKVKYEDVSTESIITTIEIAKKLGKEGKFFVYPYPGGAVYGVNETDPLVIDGMEQDAKTFSENIGIIHSVAFNVLRGTEQEINDKISTEIMDAIRNKYIDETFRNKFYVGSTSNSYLFIDVDYSFGKKFSISEKAIVPPTPYLTLWFNLIEPLTGERKKIPMEIDFSTFLSLTKQLNEINEHVEKFEAGEL